MRRAEDIPAVVVGINVNGLAVARALGRCGVPVIGVAADLSCPEARSRYLRQVWVHPGKDDSLTDLLLERAEGLRARPVLLPVMDGAVRAIASRQDRLRDAYRIAMPSAELVMKLLDKRGFSELLERLSLPGPRTFFVDRAEDMPGIARQALYPCVLKPQVKSRAYSRAGGRKAYVLASADSLLNTYAKLSSEEPRVVVQEFVPGGDEEVHFCLQYYDRRSQPLASFTGRKIRQWPPQCGGTALCQPVQAEELVRLSTEFFQRCDYHGLGSMEFKRDVRDGSFKMIEPTVCRTDWQSGVADANGLPIAYVAYCDLTGRPAPPRAKPARPTKWIHLQSDRMSVAYYRRKGELGWLDWLASIRPPIRGAIWAPDDPGPAVAMIAKKLRAKVGRLAGCINGREHAEA